MVESRGRMNVCPKITGRMVGKHRFGTRYGGEYTPMEPRKRFTLMPLIALLGLSLTVTLPMLSGMRLHAASATRYTTVVVRSGDTLWSIAAANTAADADVQATIDRISSINHLRGAMLQPGEHLRIPQ